MIGQIQATNKSQSGKTIGVQINGIWYTSKNFELQQEVGKTIIFEPSTSVYNGQTMNWLNDYVFEGSANTPATQAFDQAHQAAPPQGHPAAQQPYSPPQSAPVDVPRETRDLMVFMPFTSNAVAHAIQAGLVETPQDIEKWANAAFSAAKSCITIPY